MYKSHIYSIDLGIYSYIFIYTQWCMHSRKDSNMWYNRLANRDEKIKPCESISIPVLTVYLSSVSSRDPYWDFSNDGFLESFFCVYGYGIFRGQHWCASTKLWYLKKQQIWCVICKSVSEMCHPRLFCRCYIKFWLANFWDATSSNAKSPSEIDIFHPGPPLPAKKNTATTCP